MKNQAQLIAYVDRISAGTFRDLRGLVDGPLSGVFGGVHVLPFFHPIDGADAGFDPIDHTQVDARLGTWDDVAALAAGRDVMADVIVNHISRRSPQFADYDQHGDASPWAGMFLTYSHVFPHGASESDLLALQTLQPRLPFTRHGTGHGDEVLLWTTFTSEQVDIDVHHVEGRRYLDAILARLHAAGVRAIRLDAVGFVVKKAGTSCFMIPETFTFIADMTSRARALGMEVLVEVHGHYQDQVDVARHVDWVYDFVLPPLVLHTLYTRDATRLMHWIDVRPRNAVTVLDTHDGIGVQDAGADRRRQTILLGLTLFATACFLFAIGQNFLFFAALMALSGIAIGIFKTGALALIGDLATSTRQHTSIMNTLEGFFGIGAIVGPAILTQLLGAGLSWKWLYVMAGIICLALIAVALTVRYPTHAAASPGLGFSGTARAVKNPYVLGFSLGAFLYVGVEAAVYVWMPTLLAGYTGTARKLSAYSISIFFLLRAAGRFLGAWMLSRVLWQAVLALFSGCTLACFVVSVTGVVGWAVYLLPLSGLFMSVIYPTINSKGISCLSKSDHGAGAGVILFFTCVSAVLAPLAIGAVSDAFGQIVYGFCLAAVLAGLLFAWALINWLVNPTGAVLERLDATDYRQELPI